MGRVEGKVALITGAARGQGRSHAIRLAQEGADIIAVDICDQVESTPYALATEADLAETARLVEELDRRIETRVCDVRDAEKLATVVEEGVAALGRLDIVSANAGVIAYDTLDNASPQMWQDILGTNLTGVWNTVKAAVPHIRAGGRGGAITITGTSLMLKSFPNTGPYASSKFGLVGVMRTLALELGREGIRVNIIIPGQCDTDLVHNEATYKLFRPDLQQPTRADFDEAARTITAMDIPYVEPIDISNALLYLSSDEARYVTGATLAVDAGTGLM